MSEKTPTGLPLESDDPGEHELWNELGNFEPENPSPRLRQSFYRKLEQVGRPALLERLRGLFGFSGNAGWITAAACLLIGIGAGRFTGESAVDDARFAALEENVAVLNRSLILDRLENDTASKRLRGVIDAAYLVGEDAEITRALLLRAAEDRVPSVRTAAITALGPQLNSPGVGERIMQLLREAESPLVQLSLVDLVLRHGSQRQLSQLLELAENGTLNPDVAQHVLNSLQTEVA